MRAAGLALLALAAVWPRWMWARAALAAGAAGLLVAAVWPDSFRGRDNWWAVPVAVLAVLALWWSAPRLPSAAQRRHQLPWLALSASAFAVYCCVPETDQMREVAVVVVAGLVSELLLRRPLPVPAVLAAAGFVEWSALYGATGQGRALVGGLFALTPVVAVGLAGRAHERSWLSWTVCGVWSAAAVVMARTGGIAHRLPPAVRSAAACAAVATAISAVLWRRARRTTSAAALHR